LCDLIFAPELVMVKLILISPSCTDPPVAHSGYSAAEDWRQLHICRV